MNCKFVKFGIADAICDHRVDQLTTGLWEFNGRQGAKEDYKYLAIQGIWDEKDACSTNLISVIEYDQMKTNFSNITNYFTFDKCD